MSTFRHSATQQFQFLDSKHNLSICYYNYTYNIFLHIILGMEREKYFQSQNEQGQTEREELPNPAPSFDEHMRNMAEKSHRKTFEEKAKEKGYYKNKDGIWVERDDYGFNEQTGCFEPGYGDGHERPVGWFKLDEEYPDLADKTEALAEKYQVDYSDFGGLKAKVYENADRLSDASEEHLENIFTIASAISFSHLGTSEKLFSYSPEELKNISTFIDDYYITTAQQLPDGKLNRKIMDISECFVLNYSSRLNEGDFINKLSEYSAKAFQNNTEGYLLIHGIESGINGISQNEGSGKNFGVFMDYANELLSDKEKITKYDTKFDVINTYVRNHGVDEKTINGFRDVIFPLLAQKDSEVSAILYGSNAYGVVEGQYGIADYTEECLLSTYDPGDIDKLIRIYHEIPTSDYKKFEQNRKDALRLQDTIIGGRDFIHDECVGVNEVLSAIKDYYDNRNSEDSEKYKQKLEELEKKYHFGVLPYALNFEKYEQPIEYMAEGSVADAGSPDERAIDILNRLVENTRPNLIQAPVTKYPELNNLMKNIVPLINEQTGEVRVDINEVGAAVTAINELILKNRDKQGIYPSTISAIAFLDKMSTYALRGVKSKEAKELVFDPDFKEIVRFSQLTSSVGYNENDFEKKYNQVLGKVGEAYKEDEIEDSVVAEGYRILSQNILQNMQSLGKKYASKSTTKRFSEAIWSGNLSDELIGLFQRV